VTAGDGVGEEVHLLHLCWGERLSSYVGFAVRPMLRKLATVEWLQ
jgi:hypothetical protein